MIKNYLKIAWRNIITQKFYAFLNISGLALGIGCCLLIYLYICYQLSFDTYHKRADNLFRVVCELHFDKPEFEKGTSVAVLNAMRSRMPQIAQSALLLNEQSAIVSVKDGIEKRFKEDNSIGFTNAAWFKLFSYRFVKGNPSQLDEPNTVVLTQELAHKYFRDKDPVGNTIQINGRQIKIIGLIADAPFNTDLRAGMYVSMNSLIGLIPLFEKDYFTNWGYQVSKNNGFVLLKDIKQKDIIEKNLNRMAKENFGSDSFVFKLLPLKEMHFNAQYGGKIQKPLLLTLAIIGLLIISIAGINYINMMIARLGSKSVEIGTRKVLGASGKQLFVQFMTECFLNAVIATFIAVIGVILIMPTVNTVLFNNDPIHVLSYQQLFLFSVLILFIITVVTGIYPTILLSRMPIWKALKNNAWTLPAGISRKLLVVLQNVVAQVLIASTIIIVMQVHFLTNTDKGFNRQFVITMPVGNASDSQKEQLRYSLQHIPQVRSFSFCLKSPSSDSQRGATIRFSNRDWETWPVRYAIGDSAYCRTFGIRLIAGRNIRDHQPLPEFLVNEMMVARLHVKSTNDVIGKALLAGDRKGVIVGVVKDFAIKSLLEPIEPSIILETKELQTNLAIKLSGEQTAATLSALQKAYMRIFPDQIFSYQFVDDQIAELYKAEILQQKLISLAAVVAIFISCLGLLGLISLITLQRTKEIGIRKVLGASVSNITIMLSKDFLLLVVIAILIASPFAGWFMHKWLQQFAYCINIQWWVFALTGMIALFIAFVTVSFQAINAAMANPVKSLRNE